ncbi:MAG TPA: methyltransferase domain-containing protein [Terracidiphilus sp.]|jgi:SAM-dependent methyltransferase|nr:methyltransferase domain-containing protein [Terracidiphilus sp.]
MQSEAFNFDQRAQLTELMDEPCSYAELRECLRDLMSVNRTVFTYRPTLEWLEQFVVSDQFAISEQFASAASEPLHIVDVGSGAGDMLRRIERWARDRRIAVRLTGVDRNPYAARAATEFGGTDSAIEWVTCDAYAYRPERKIDVVISSLFTHHLADAEIVEFLKWMEQVAARGWFVNDLRRGRVPYYAFALLANAMRWHKFVRHDGPVSVRRSFSTEDWLGYLRQAGLDEIGVEVYTRRLGRLCVSRVKA